MIIRSSRPSLLRAGGGLAVAEMVGFLVPLLILPHLTRALGESGYGRIQTVLALGAFAGLLANPGFGPLVTRRCAIHPGDASRVFGEVQPLRVFFGVLAAGCLVLGPLVAGWSAPTRLLLALQATILLAQSFSADAYLVGIGDAGWVGLVRAMSLLFYGFGVLALVKGADDAPLVLLLALLTTAIFVVMSILRFRHRAGRLGWHFSVRSAAASLREATGYAGASVMSLIYAQIDILFLRAFRGEGAVGVYAACARVTEGVYAVLNVILGATFPRVVTESRLRPRRAACLAQRSLRVSGMIIVPTAVGAAVAGGPIMSWFTGFEGTDLTMAILGIAVVAGACAAVYTSFGLMSRGRSRALLFATGFGAVVNTVLNFVAVPLFGGPGAAGTVALAQAAVALIAARLSSDHLRLSPLKALGAWAIPAVGMGATVALLRWYGVHPAVLLATGVVSYSGLVLGTGRLRAYERRGLRRILAALRRLKFA